MRCNCAISSVSALPVNDAWFHYINSELQKEVQSKAACFL
jgi:hypothetical protein